MGFLSDVFDTAINVYHDVAGAVLAVPNTFVDIAHGRNIAESIIRAPTRILSAGYAVANDVSQGNLAKIPVLGNTYKGATEIARDPYSKTGAIDLAHGIAAQGAVALGVGTLGAAAGAGAGFKLANGDASSVISNVSNSLGLPSSIPGVASSLGVSLPSMPSLPNIPVSLPGTQPSGTVSPSPKVSVIRQPATVTTPASTSPVVVNSTTSSNMGLYIALAGAAVFGVLILKGKK